MLKLFNRLIESWEVKARDRRLAKEEHDFEEGRKYVHDTIAAAEAKVKFIPIKLEHDVHFLNTDYARGIRQGLKDIQGTKRHD